jgi:hypothetical protein
MVLRSFDTSTRSSARQQTGGDVFCNVYFALPYTNVRRDRSAVRYAQMRAGPYAPSLAKLYAEGNTQGVMGL